MEISPAITTWPVVTSVSHATRPIGSEVMTASRTPSEIWSAILSGWPSVTDSDVKRNSRMRYRRLSSENGGEHSNRRGRDPRAPLGRGPVTVAT